MDISTIQKLLDSISNIFPTLLPVLSFIVGLVLFVVSYAINIDQYGMGLAFIIAAFVCLWLNKHLENKNDILSKIPIVDHLSYRIKLVTNIVFFVAFTLSVLVIYTYTYIRPPIYFGLIALAFFSLFIEAFFVHDGGFQTNFNILKTLLISISFRAGRFFNFPTIPGSDTHYHLNLVTEIIDSYHFLNSDLNPIKYVYSPLWHMYMSLSEILLNTSPSKVLFLSVGAMFIVILSLFIFLIVRKMFNSQVGLIAVIIINIADMIFVRGVTNITTSSLVHCFFIIILFCLITNKNRAIFQGIILLLMVESLLTHQLSTFCIFAIFWVLFAAKYLYDKLILNNNIENIHKIDQPLFINFIPLLFFTVCMILDWGFTGGQWEKDSFFRGMVVRLDGTISRIFQDYSSSGAPSSTVYENMFGNYDVASNILYTLGYDFLLALAIIGIIISCYKQNRSLSRWAFISATLVLFGIIYPGTVLGLGQIFIPHRFISFLEILLVMFAAYAAYLMYHYTNGISIKKILFSASIFLMIFLLITTPYINRNDPLYCTDREQRTGLYLSELAPIAWANNYSPIDVLTVDPYISSRTLSTVEVYDLSLVKIQSISPNSNLGLKSSVYIMRKYFEDQSESAVIAGTFGKLVLKNYREAINSVKIQFNTVYTSGSTRIYS